MTLRNAPHSTGRGGAGLGIFYGLLAALGLLTARLWPQLLWLLPPCPFRALTGYPCPFCGARGAVVAVASGHIATALAQNPLIVLALLAVTIWFALDLLRLATRQPLRLLTGPGATLALRWAAGAAILLNWLYLITRHIGLLQRLAASPR